MQFEMSRVINISNSKKIYEVFLYFINSHKIYRVTTVFNSSYKYFITFYGFQLT